MAKQEKITENIRGIWCFLFANRERIIILVKGRYDQEEKVKCKVIVSLVQGECKLGMLE